jgi:hypothetical protein
MGGKASKPQAATVTEQPEEVSSPETESGVVLAIDFQSTYSNKCRTLMTDYTV